MKRFLLPLCVILAAVLTLSLAGCASSGLSEDEIRETYRSLVEQSYVLNDIYYGDGLPYVEDTAAMEALLGAAGVSSSFRVSYMPVAADAPMQSEAEIREATSAVFSPAMAEHLFTLGFSGMSTEDAGSVTYARYIEQDGTLTVRIDLADEALPIGRTYDFDAMTLIADEESRILASFPTTLDGKPSVNVKLTLVRTPDGWRLDSPTY